MIIWKGKRRKIDDITPLLLIAWAMTSLRNNPGPGYNIISDPEFGLKRKIRGWENTNRNKNMKKMQTKTIIGIILAIISAAILMLCNWMYLRHNCVKPAISMGHALIKRDNTNYFIIVREAYLGEWGGWCYLDGWGKKPVYLLGRTPQSELCGDLSCLEAGNRFLVKGILQTEYSEFTERDVIMVESWDIIAPILRINGADGPDQRLIRPLLYLDRYDVEIGAFFKIITDIRAIKSLEEKLIWKNSEIPCYYITSDVINGKVQWYLAGDEVREYKIYNYSGIELIPISLEGVPLESHFNEKMLNYFRNEFLVKGKYDRENGILKVIEWYITCPINRRNDFYNSPVYFTEEDVLNGFYMP